MTVVPTGVASVTVPLELTVTLLKVSALEMLPVPVKVTVPVRGLKAPADLFHVPPREIVFAPATTSRVLPAVLIVRLPARVIALPRLTVDAALSLIVRFPMLEVAPMVRAWPAAPLSTMGRVVSYVPRMLMVVPVRVSVVNAVRWRVAPACRVKLFRVAGRPVSTIQIGVPVGMTTLSPACGILDGARVQFDAFVP